MYFEPQKFYIGIVDFLFLVGAWLDTIPTTRFGE
jgi:hypothetical protein